MKIAFVSNYFNHHQKPFCDAMCQRLQDAFVFIETSVMREERKKLGYGQDTKPAYVKSTLQSKTEAQACQSLIDEAEVVIFGGAPYDMVINRLKTGKLTFKYSERIYKKIDCPWWKLPRHAVQFYWMYGRFSKLYLLSAGAYAASDYAKLGLFKGKAYKWGYFPETKKHNISELMLRKNDDETVKLLWAGRMIGWKHPEHALEIAEKLHNDGIAFYMDMIGNGQMEDELHRMAKNKGLSEYIHFTGGMNPGQVRECMEQADIFLFTSDRQEGWGAVLNEAMNSGCAIVASNTIGAVSYLLHHGKNGYIYEAGNVDDAYGYVKRLVQNADLRNEFGKTAYQTLVDEWNAEVAAERFLVLCKSLSQNAQCAVFQNGPCSQADEKEIV